MEQLVLVALIGAIAVVMLALARILVRPRAPASRPATEPAGEATFAVSTEGMKVCPKCGMGNMWTESRCISCGGGLRG